MTDNIRLPDELGHQLQARRKALEADLNGKLASVEEGMHMLKALAPDAHISISGKPLAFPMGHSDEPLKACEQTTRNATKTCTHRECQ